MIKRENIVVIELNKEQLDECRQRARNAEIGGRSRIYQDHNERMNHLGEDQFLGQVGQMCLSIHLTGDVLSYREARDKADANPTAGDGGEDLVGVLTDIKCSRMRSKARRMGDYSLVVPPREFHEGFMYILALVSYDGDHNELTALKVNLVGWNNSDELERVDDWLGHGAKYTKTARELHPLSSIIAPDWLEEDEKLMTEIDEDTESILADDTDQSEFGFMEVVVDKSILETGAKPRIRGLL